MNRKKKIILALGILILLGSVIFFLYKRRQPSPPPTPPKGELQLLQVVPSEGKNKTLFTSTGIQFTFDGPLVLSTVKVSIEPRIKILTDTARSSSSILIVRPEDEWVLDVAYTITIKNGLQSVNNKELKEDIIYQIEFEAVEDIISF